MMKITLPLAAAFAVALSGTTAFAGYVPVLDFPNLQFAPAGAETLVTRDLAPQPNVCSQLERAAELSPKDCGELSAAELAKLKMAQDD